MSFGVETSDDLLEAVKRDLKIPASQPQAYTDQRILSIAYEKLVSRLVPMLLSVNQGWFQTQSEYVMTAGTDTYLYPQYAMYQKISTATIVNAVTNEEVPLIPCEINERRYHGYGTQGFPNYCYSVDNSLTLVPAPDAGVSTAYRLRFVYFRMPGKLVPISAAAKVQSVNYATGQVTYTATPPAGFTSTSTHDFYSNIPPFKRLQNAITATNLAANVQTFPVTSVQTLVAGNYVNIVDETIYPALPYGMFTNLKELTMHSLSCTQMDAATAAKIEQMIVESARNVLMSAPGNRFVQRMRKIPMWDNALIDGTGQSRGRGVFP